MIFVVTVLKLGNLTNRSAEVYFLCMNRDLRRSRLNGWKLWYTFCTSVNVGPQDFCVYPEPLALYADFVVDMAAREVSQHARQETQPAVQDLYHAIGRKVDFADNYFLRVLTRNTSAKIKSKPRYTTIWKLGILLRYICSLPEPESLPWSQLMAVSVAVFMIFVPCRTVALTRIDPTTATVDPLTGQIKVRAKEKTDFGQGQSELLFRSLPNARLSPKRYFDLLAKRSLQKGCGNRLFVSEAGTPYTRTDSMRKAVLIMMGKAGIPAHYTTNSIRHSWMSDAFAHGWSEAQVNAYSGHSPAHHTALKFYIAKMGEESSGERDATRSACDNGIGCRISSAAGGGQRGIVGEQCEECRRRKR
jgi:hypothetical protein